MQDDAQDGRRTRAVCLLGVSLLLCVSALSWHPRIEPASSETEAASMDAGDTEDVHGAPQTVSAGSVRQARAHAPDRAAPESIELAGGCEPRAPPRA